MSNEDLLRVLDIGSNSIADSIKRRLDDALIINIFLTNGTMIKLGGGSPDGLSVSSITNIAKDFLTIEYDSHETDVLYTGIAKIEYFYKEFGGV